MAIWQYTFLVLPKDGVQVLSTSTNNGLGKTIDGFEDDRYWKYSTIKRDLFNAVGHILPKSKSWSNEIDLYGNQDSNCFEVFFDKEDTIQSVSFRIDFKDNYRSILQGILEFCRHNGLIVLDESLSIVPLNYEYTHRIILTSPQRKKYNQMSENDQDGRDI
ncbi:hypothetical protein H8B06_07705 [Sphingobacterium sp. DN00404]|uniref:Uncharacterized protein n=1 Tax=Sphingobacterium micropteri TaxID=2763501 RepID=A0ABR7YNF2_9SPHI|nr:hypothetical protein [Sphingobacterium micropteri]MBD1432703.1 hypothetical protein [Sphingobacterium micropteri]